MKAIIGTVTGQSIGKNRDGDKDVRLLQVQMIEPDNVEEIQQIEWAGIDSAPINGDEVAIIEISESYKIAIASDGNNAPSVNAGEKKISSRDSNGDIASSIYLKSDGQMILNGGGDYAVRFNELKTAFNELKSDFNTFVTTKYNLHNHPTAPVGPVSPPSVTGSSSSADIDPAKSGTIEVP
jgi:hypothetical protein